MSRQQFLQAYAIVRYETVQPEYVPIEMRVSVKKIVFDRQTAQSEVARLNSLVTEAGAHYFCHTTRVEQPFTSGDIRASEPGSALVS